MLPRARQYYYENREILLKKQAEYRAKKKAERGPVPIGRPKGSKDAVKRNRKTMTMPEPLPITNTLFDWSAVDYRENSVPLSQVPVSQEYLDEMNWFYTVRWMAKFLRKSSYENQQLRRFTAIKHENQIQYAALGRNKYGHRTITQSYHLNDVMRMCKGIAPRKTDGKEQPIPLFEQSGEE